MDYEQRATAALARSESLGSLPRAIPGALAGVGWALLAILDALKVKWWGATRKGQE